MSAAIDDLLSAVLLAVDGHELTGRDLLATGVVSDRWQRLESELAEGIGLIAAEPPPDADVAEDVRVFRLERGLLSAEDVRAWLQPRGLTMAGVKAAAARAVARRRGGTPEPVTAAQVAEALPAEAICTGALREIGAWLADRMLSAATIGRRARALAAREHAGPAPRVRGGPHGCRCRRRGSRPGARGAAGVDRSARRRPPRLGGRRDGRP